MGLLQERYKKYREPQRFMEMGVYPYFRAISGKQGTEVEMEGQKVLMFGSNAYTGLTGDQRIIDAAKEALDKYGSGCAGSRFLNGTIDLHVELEKDLAEFVKKEEALCQRASSSILEFLLSSVVVKTISFVMSVTMQASWMEDGCLSPNSSSSSTTTWRILRSNSRNASPMLSN